MREISKNVFPVGFALLVSFGDCSSALRGALTHPLDFSLLPQDPVHAFVGALLKIILGETSEAGEENI